MKKVALIVAMEAEAEGLVESLGLNAVEPNQFYAHLPFRFFCGNYKNCLEISITLPGKDSRFGVDNIGTEPAAVATFAAIKEFAPDVLINAGTAGSFAKKGAHVGKVYLSESAFFFHDHRIPIQGWDKFGIGELPSLDVRNLALRLGLETANVSSGNSLDFTPQDILAIERSGAQLKEMEAAGIAWVAWICKVPFFAIKSVTNLIDDNPDSANEFEKNFALAVANLTKTVLEVIDALAEEAGATGL